MVVVDGKVVVVELGGTAVVVVVELGPCDTTTSTDVLGATLVPAAGLVDMTSPFAMVGDDAYVTLPSVRLCDPSVFAA